MSKLMIMGAGIYQVPLIKKAQAIGHEVIVVSYPGPYPGLDIADVALPIDTTDAAAVLDAARRLHIDGILTTGTDVAVRTIGTVCDALGLPGVSEQSAITLTDKAAMKRAFASGNVPTAAFEEVRTLDEAMIAAQRIGFPVMVKACDVSGSRGITKVDSLDTIPAAYEAALRATHTDHIVVEQFVAGNEIGVDGFVVDGELALFAPHDKFTHRAGGVTIPAGHAFPLHASRKTLGCIQDAIERALAACGLANGAFNSDVILTPEGGASVLELGGRCGATCIPELISIYTGIDYYEQMIRASLGQSVNLTPANEPIPCMSKLLFSEHDGTVKRIDREKITAIEQHFHAEITLDVHEGDHVHAVHDGTDRFGSIVMPTAQENELDAALDELKDCIELA